MIIDSEGIGNSGMYGITPSSRISGVTVIGRRGSTNTHGISNMPPLAKAAETILITSETKEQNIFAQYLDYMSQVPTPMINFKLKFFNIMMFL